VNAPRPPRSGESERVARAERRRHETWALQEIRAFWQQRAEQFKTSPQATLWEMPLRELEIAAILRYVRDGVRVLDAGCGNGYSTLAFARARRAEFHGIDYAPKMIQYARENLRQTPRAALRGRVHFFVGDVLTLGLAATTYDVVITERCLQNLPSWELQRAAIEELLRVLKPGGRLIMAECSLTGLRRLNRWRRWLGKKELTDAMPWHNLFFEDDRLLNLPALLPAIRSVHIDHYASTYMFLTRLIERGSSLFRWLPNVGRWGYFKIYVIDKRG